MCVNYSSTRRICAQQRYPGSALAFFGQLLLNSQYLRAAAIPRICARFFWSIITQLSVSARSSDTQAWICSRFFSTFQFLEPSFREQWSSFSSKVCVREFILAHGAQFSTFQFFEPSFREQWSSFSSKVCVREFILAHGAQFSTFQFLEPSFREWWWLPLPSFSSKVCVREFSLAENLNKKNSITGGLQEHMYPPPQTMLSHKVHRGGAGGNAGGGGAPRTTRDMRGLLIVNGVQSSRTH